MKLLIGGLVGLIIATLVYLYFSLATFFRVQAKALTAVEKAENARKNAAQTNATKKKSKAQAG